MPRKSRWWRRRPDKYRGGRIEVNGKDYSRHDYMSPGKLVAWADYMPERRVPDGRNKNRLLHSFNSGAGGLRGAKS